MTLMLFYLISAINSKEKHLKQQKIIDGIPQGKKLLREISGGK